MSSQPEIETLKFKLGLSGTFWAKKPEFTVLLDGKEVNKSAIEGASDEVQYVEFESTLVEGEHELVIRLTNKTDLDTFVGADGKIERDMLLNIDSIEIDEIDLGTLKWSKSLYIPDNTAHSPMKECVNLGWNGAYSLKFTSPFYLWLLENM